MQMNEQAKLAKAEERMEAHAAAKRKRQEERQAEKAELKRSAAKSCCLSAPMSCTQDRVQSQLTSRTSHRKAETADPRSTFSTDLARASLAFVLSVHLGTLRH